MMRTLSALFYATLVAGILFCELSDGAKIPKLVKKKQRGCPREIKKVPVHQKFNMNRFKGTWYTVRRTEDYWGENTFRSASMEINKNEDGTFTYAMTGKQKNEKCFDLQTGKLEPTNRAGSLHLLQDLYPGTRVPMIVSFTDYKNLAIVYYCFEPDKKEQCCTKGRFVEIMSRSVTPSKKMVDNYVKRAAKRIRIKPNMLKATTPGLCVIKDIREASKQEEAENADGAEEDLCEVSKIPVQEGYNLTLMDGLWYELARTRFTPNPLQSVVTRHTYDAENDVINSLYTGALYFPENDTSLDCQKAIHGMSRTRENATEIADMEGRIVGGNFEYPWAPMKVLFADANYLMFYACYRVGPLGQCLEGAKEVTLLGRTPEISEETRDVIYEHLSDVCTDPKYMIETKSFTDCSKYVRHANERKLPDVPVDEDYDINMLSGVWYLYASIRYSNDTLSGAVMTTTATGREEPIHSYIHAHDFNNASICNKYEVTAREMCLDQGDHIITPPTGLNGTFNFRKILNISNDLLVEYICSKRNLDDTCEKTGIQFNVYTKNMALLNFPVNDNDDVAEDGGDNPVDAANNDDANGIDADNEGVNDNEPINDNDDGVDNDAGGVGEENEDRDGNDNEDGSADNQHDVLDELNAIKAYYNDLISNLARDNYIDPDDLQFETEWCTDDASKDMDHEEHTHTVCDIDKFEFMGTLDDFIQEGVYGYWFEIVKTQGVNHLDSTGPLVAFISPESNVTLKIFYKSTAEEGEESPVCAEVRSTTLLPRCNTFPDGDFLARFQHTDIDVTYVPFKIIYTDYDNVMLTYVCEKVRSDGECDKDSAFIRVWARRPFLSDDEIENVLYYSDWACVDTEAYTFLNFTHTEDSVCFREFTDYIEERHKRPMEVAPSPDDVVNEQNEQPNQDKDSFPWLDDIDHELFTPDEEFFAPGKER